MTYLVLLAERGDCTLANTADGGAAFLLDGNHDGLCQVLAHKRFDFFVNTVRCDDELFHHLRLPNGRGPDVDFFTRLGDGFVTFFNREQHFIRRQEIAKTFNHEHSLIGAREHQIQPRRLHLFRRGIDDGLIRPRGQAHAHANHGLLQRNVAHRERRRRRRNRQSIRRSRPIIAHHPL